MLSQHQLDAAEKWSTEGIYDGAETAYNRAHKINSILPKNEDDIQSMVEYIEGSCSDEYSLKRFGIFISACVNASSTEEIKLTVKKPLSYMGLYNNNYVTIKGDVGAFAGEEMSGGQLAIEGNAEEYLGNRLHGGEITVRGTCGPNLGSFMDDGKIIIEGSCGRDIAPCATGGIVEVYGDCGDRSPFTDASVYHKGELLEPHPGRRIA